MAARNVGLCRLCLSEGELEESHFIPKAAYRLIRGKGANRNPLVVGSKSAKSTSIQIEAHLLCRHCEQRFHQGGEDTFFRFCYRSPGKFKLLAMLRQTTPAVVRTDSEAYLVTGVNVAVVEQLAYFGASLFWRSSVHQWTGWDGESLPSITLGPYQERLRRFLIGAAEFPEDGALVIEVCEENNRLNQTFGFPGTLKRATHFAHWIHILGVRFNLVLGQQMPMSVRQLSAVQPSGPIVLVSKNEESEMRSLYADLWKSLARKSANGERA